MAVTLVGGQQNQAVHQPFFAGSPCTKFLALSAILFYVLLEGGGLGGREGAGLLSLDVPRLIHDGEIHRLFLSGVTFGSVGELVVGLAVLCPLSRRFEREMGSRKFGTFVFFTSALSVVFQIICSQTLHDGGARYNPGPYPLLGALLFLYHRYTPRLHPRFFGALGFDFSEKAITYFFALQAIFSGGIATLIPAVCGAVGGYICSAPSLPMHKAEMPDFVYDVCGAVGGALADEGHRPIVMSRRHAGAAGGGRRGGVPAGAGAATGGNRRQQQRLVPDAGGFGEPGAAMGMGMGSMGGAAAPPQPQFEAPPPPPPPSEEAIAQLTGMGFEREAVIQALQRSDNNVEVAANHLLSGT